MTDTKDQNTQPLKLQARDLKDLSVLSSLIQDAIVPPADMAYWPDDKAFVLALNRFKWEEADTPPYARTHAALRIEGVTAVQRKNITPKQDNEALLDLLALAHADDSLVIQFADDRAIRLTIDRLAISLHDLGSPWPTQWKPGHDA